MIYLDNAATTFRKPETVKQAVWEAFSYIGNAGRGAHGATLEAARTIYGTRELLAGLFHVKDPSRIAFTCNATESLNTAIFGLFQKGDHVITTVCEHNSVLRPLYRKAEEGVELTIVPTAFSDPEEKKAGILDYEFLEQSWKPNTKGIVITHASNLTGNVTDLKRVSAFARKKGLLLVVDASQTAGAWPIDVEELGIDVLCFTGHKGLLGPQGTGGIYVREGILPAALKVGGSGVHSYDKKHPENMPTALEAGTLNGHGIAGLHAAAAYLQETGISNIRRKEQELLRHFVAGVSRIPGVILYGDPELSRRTAIASINIRNLDSGTVSDWLWEDYQIATRAGAHCAPLMHQALGTAGQGAVRFSFSHYNTMEEVDAAIRAIRELSE